MRRFLAGYFYSMWAAGTIAAPIFVWIERIVFGNVSDGPGNAVALVAQIVALFGLYTLVLRIFRTRLQGLTTAELQEVDPQEVYHVPLMAMSLFVAFLSYRLASALFFPETTLKAFMLDSLGSCVIGTFVCSGAILPLAFLGLQS